MSQMPASKLRRGLLIVVQLTAFFAILRLDCADADANGLFRRFHVWGHFRPGTWVVVRQGCETVDHAGKVVSTSTTETRTTLENVDERTLTFRVQSSLEVGGKKLDAPPQEVHEGYPGRQPDNSAAEVIVGEEAMVVQGRKYACQIFRTESIADGKKTIVQAWRSPEAAPFDLRRHTKVVDAATGKTIDETVAEVVSLSVQRRILARSRPVAEVRVVQHHPRGQTTSQVVNCPEIPGGVVSQTTEEFDASGQLLRRVKVELVDFESK